MTPQTRQRLIARYNQAAKLNQPEALTERIHNPPSALTIRVLNCPVCRDEFFNHEGFSAEDDSLFCSKGCRSVGREMWPGCRYPFQRGQDE